MDKHQLQKRSIKPHKQPQCRLAGYIDGSIKIDEMVRKEKLTKLHDRHNKAQLLASINSMDTSSVSTSKSRKIKKLDTKPSHRKPESIKPTSSIRSEHSAQGDTHSGRNLVHSSKTSTTLTTLSKSNSDFFEQLLNERDEQIISLKEQLNDLQTCTKSSVEPKTVITSTLEKLLKQMSTMNPSILNRPQAEGESNNSDVLVEHLSNGVQVLCKMNTDREQKLSQFCAENEKLQKRIETLETELQKEMEVSEKQTRDLREMEMKNSKLQTDLHLCTQTYRTAKMELEKCTELQSHIQQEFNDKMSKLQNINKNLREADQLQNAVISLEKTYQNHVQYLELTPNDEAERLKAEVQNMEMSKMQQICAIAADCDNLKRELEELHEKNKRLSDDHKKLHTFIISLSNEIRRLKYENRHLRKEKCLLEETCQRLIDPNVKETERVEAMAKLKIQTFDQVNEYSQDLMKHLEETIGLHLTKGSNENDILSQ